MSNPIRFVPDTSVDARIAWRERKGINELKPPVYGVILKINDLKAWELCGYQTGAEVASSSNFWIVTTHLTSDQIAAIKTLKFVISYEISREDVSALKKGDIL